jgi:hypothetical protein
MAWVIHYRDVINGREVTSSAIGTRESAMDQAHTLFRKPGCAVSHINGPNNQRIEIPEISKWRSGRQRAPSIRERDSLAAKPEKQKEPTPLS